MNQRGWQTWWPRNFLEQVDEKFSDTRFFGMYMDDGLVVFNSTKTKTQIQTWLNDIQLTADVAIL
jgi:hypothetical protein